MKGRIHFSMQYPIWRSRELFPRIGDVQQRADLTTIDTKPVLERDDASVDCGTGAASREKQEASRESQARDVME